MLLKTPSLVNFNPSNKEHRLAVKSFLKRNAWVDSPIRFAHDPTYTNVVDQVRAKTLAWYLAHEAEVDFTIYGKQDLPTSAGPVFVEIKEIPSKMNN